MIKSIEKILQQPYWVLCLILGAIFVAAPCVTISNDKFFDTHPPTTLWLLLVGLGLLTFSVLAFGYTLIWRQSDTKEIGTGVDLGRVKENDGVLWTIVNNCEIRVITGRLEEYASAAHTVVVLPCNEYFDDECVNDSRSALGAYVNRVFEGQVPDFVALMKSECARRLGPGKEQQKTEDERAISFGAGRCILLVQPLGRAVPVALISTTTQRAGQGLASRLSYLFDGVTELVAQLANQRINEIVMPILGSGHGGIDPPLALVGLLGAVSEAARYGLGGQRPKKVTIVLFRRNEKSPPQVDQVVVRRALALIGSPA